MECNKGKKHKTEVDIRSAGYKNHQCGNIFEN